VTVEDPLIQQLAERLRRAMRETRQVETAQIQILGLNETRRRAVGMWAELAQRAPEISAKFIAERLAAHDLMIPAGDGFLVVYAQPKEALAQSQDLQEALDGLYMRESWSPALRAEVRHQSLQADAVIQTLIEPAPFKPALTTLPVWSLSQQAVTGYWTVLDHGPQRPVRYGYDSGWSATGWHAADKDYLDLDLAILERAVAATEAGLAAGRKCLIGYSAHATTLQNKARRRAYFDALSEVPAPVRPYLIGRMAELQQGTPLAAISDWTQQMRQISPRVTMEIHRAQRDALEMVVPGVYGVACVLPSSFKTPVDVVQQARHIQIWKRDIGRANLRLRLDNVAEPRLLIQALDLQIDYFSCAALWPPVADADGVKPFTRDQILRAIARLADERSSA
jgi:hypothetical protein